MPPKPISRAKPMDSERVRHRVPSILRLSLCESLVSLAALVYLESTASAGVPFTIKATFENPTAPGEISLLALLPDGTILAQTPFINSAPDATIFKINQDGKMLATASWALRADIFSRDPATNHFFLLEESSSGQTPRFHEFDADLNVVRTKPTPRGYFGKAGATISRIQLRDGSEVRFVDSNSTLFVLDPQKNLVRDMQLSTSYVQLMRIEGDHFLTLNWVTEGSVLTTYDHTGQVLLNRTIPEHYCHFIPIVDQRYADKAALVCSGGSVVQLDSLGRIFDRHEIDSHFTNCLMSARAKLVACSDSGGQLHSLDLWSSESWTLVKRIAAPTLLWTAFLKDGFILRYSDRDDEVLNSALQVQTKIDGSANENLWWIQQTLSGKSLLSTRYNKDGVMLRINSLVDGSVELDLEGYQRAAGLTMEVSTPLKLSDDLYAVAFWCTAAARQSGQCHKGRILILGR